jgi:hypothetical protein
MKTCISILLPVLLCSLALGAEPKDSRPFCKTVPEAAGWVLSNAPAKTTLQIARMPKEGLIHLHFGLGMWIRNNVPVWGNEELIQSVGKNVHPDDVGAMILEEYWRLARQKLPTQERERIELFESTLGKLRGEKPKAKTHEGVLGELNAQIHAAWPKDAKYPPFALRADKETHFTWQPDWMTADLAKNVEVFVSFHRSLPFYDGDYLRVGDPNPKAEVEPDDGAKPGRPGRSETNRTSSAVGSGS